MRTTHCLNNWRQSSYAETAEHPQDDINEIFRIMHTIKGSSAMMEFSTLATVAHRIEDSFFIIRENSMRSYPKKTNLRCST